MIKDDNDTRKDVLQAGRSGRSMLGDISTMRRQPRRGSHLVAVVALDLCSHALPADAAQQLPALLLDVLDAVNGLHAAQGGHHVTKHGRQGQETRLAGAAAET
jgi:hypothetical protein